MAAAESCAKYVLLGLNLVFFLVSLPLLGTGIWLKVDKSVIHELLSMVKSDGQFHRITNFSLPLIDMLAFFLIVIGSITLIIGFCGCCGAMKENKILLYIYVFLVSFIVGIQLATIIVAAVKKEVIHNSVGNRLKQILEQEYGDLFINPNYFTKIFALFMMKFKCCGVDGIGDFKNVNASQNYIACCKFKPEFKLTLKTEITEEFLKANVINEECIKNANSDYVYKRGCTVTLWETISNKLKIVLGVLIGVMVLEIICIIFACCVINKSYEKLK